jgi:hypothetical protein
MRVAPNVRRLVAAAALAVLLSGCGGGGDDTTTVSRGTTTIESGPAPEADDRGDADEVTQDPRFEAAGRAAERRLRAAAADDAWAVPNAVLAPVDRLWDDRVGAYVSPGGRVSTRLNSELLRIHAAAARAGYTGPARQDERVRRIAAYLTGPAYIGSPDGERFGASRHNAIHVPGWRQSSAPVVNQHPSIDAAVARGLRAAWLARTAVAMPGTTEEAIRATVEAVASSRAFRAPARLLNQINWNADLYAAAATVTGDPTLLRDDYRAQLQWFVDHAHVPVRPGGSPNLSGGNGFTYQPETTRSATLNRSDTVEYASIVLGSLRYYDEAVRSGMQPLAPQDRATLRAWAEHTLDADWTASGYLNWETGKAGSRLHLRQYWALALDGAVAAARSAADLTGLPPSEGDELLSRADALFRRWADREGSVLLPATAFGYPSRFASVRNNRTTASVRLAATLAEWAASCGCGGRLPAADPSTAPLDVALDGELHRLAVNGPTYSTAISPVAVPTGGGLEPAWLLDARARPLGALGGGGPGTLGLALSRGGREVLDTQPGQGPRAEALTLRPVDGEPRTFSGRVTGDAAVVRVTHRFEVDRIVTRYVVDPQRPVDVEVRIPSAGGAGTVRCAGDTVLDHVETIPGCRRGRDLLVQAAGGASMHVAFEGLPTHADVSLRRARERSTVPDPGRQATLRFRLDRRTTITRTLRPDAG